MRIAFLGLGLICAVLRAAEAERTYPLWDGTETVAAYAARAALPATKRIEFENAALELVLVPAGKFLMGNPEPEPPAISQAEVDVLLALGGIFTVALVLLILKDSMRAKRARFSLSALLLLTASAGLFAGGLAREHLREKQIKSYDAACADYKLLPADDEHRARPVMIARPFYMGKFEVTQLQYKAATGGDPSNISGADLPVNNISWDDAALFCTRVNELLKDANVRLPREEQWEYACRAGTQKIFSPGRADSEYAWHQGNSTRSVKPPGLLKPNAFGLHDMLGNMWEWCEDKHVVTYDDFSPETLKVAKHEMVMHALRGGGWNSGSYDCRAARRLWAKPESSDTTTGFRVVVNVK